MENVNYLELEKTLESLLDCKEIQPVSPKGNQSWISISRTNVEAEVPILSPPDAKSWLIGKDPDAGKDWRQEEKGMTEDEMFGWHHWLSGHEFEQALGDGKGQESLACCGPWDHKDLNRTDGLNNNNLMKQSSFQRGGHSLITLRTREDHGETTGVGIIGMPVLHTPWSLSATFPLSLGYESAHQIPPSSFPTFGMGHTVLRSLAHCGPLCLANQ